LKHFFIALSLLLVSSLSHAADSDEAQTQANLLGTAMTKQDYLGVAKMTHPEVVKRMGGEDKLASYLDQAFKDGGIRFTRMQFQKPLQLNSSGRVILAKVPYQAVVSIGEEEGVSESFYIGFLVKKNQWAFVDCEGISQDILQVLSTGYDGGLNLSGC